MMLDGGQFSSALGVSGGGKEEDASVQFDRLGLQVASRVPLLSAHSSPAAVGGGDLCTVLYI